MVRPIEWVISLFKQNCYCMKCYKGKKRPSYMMYAMCCMKIWMIYYFMNDGMFCVNYYRDAYTGNYVDSFCMAANRALICNDTNEYSLGWYGVPWIMHDFQSWAACCDDYPTILAMLFACCSSLSLLFLLFLSFLVLVLGYLVSHVDIDLAVAPPIVE